MNGGNAGVAFGANPNVGATLPTGNTFQGAPFLGNINASYFKSGKFTEPPPPVKLGQIADGLSKTMLASEVIKTKSKDSNTFDLRGYIWHGNFGAYTAALAPNSSSADYVSAFCQSGYEGNPPCQTNAGWGMAARSRHKEGVQVVMLDGSVRFVADSVLLSVWRAAASSKGGESLGLP